MPTKSTPSETPDSYRAAFLDCGLRYGRRFGSKSGYFRENPGCRYVPNACVYMRDRTCAWRGDLDLATQSDVSGLVSASRLLNRKLYVMREQTNDNLRALPMRWMVENALATIWRGQMVAAGHYPQLPTLLDDSVLSRTPMKPSKP